MNSSNKDLGKEKSKVNFLGYKKSEMQTANSWSKYIFGIGILIAIIAGAFNVDWSKASENSDWILAIGELLIPLIVALITAKILSRIAIWLLYEITSRKENSRNIFDYFSVIFILISIFELLS